MCPFGSLFSMLCQTAHLGAAAEDQTRAWVPSLPVVLLLPPRGCARRFDQTTTSLMMNQRWGESPVIQTAVGRQTPPAPLPARYVAISFTKTASYLRLNHQESCDFQQAGWLTDRRIFQLQQTVLWHIHGFVKVHPSAFIAAAAGKEAELIVFTVQP